MSDSLRTPPAVDLVRPRLFLDVDGVVNIFPPHTKTDWPDVERTRCMGFPITYSPMMGARLAALDCDIVWLTTWCDEANEWIAPLFGWDALPVIQRENEVGWWKLNALRELLPGTKRPFIWIDDDINSEAEEWAHSIDTPSVLVKPETHLTPSMLDLVEQQIEKWLSRV